MSQDPEIILENKKIRTLRILVDSASLWISRGEMTREQAWELVEKVKQWAVLLFPGKEETFDLIYFPRFRRIIEERYSLHS